MSFTAIFSALVSIAKAVPKIQELIDQFYSMWIDYKISQVRENLNQYQIKEKALLKAIRSAEDDETRISLSIVLSQLQK